MSESNHQTIAVYVSDDLKARSFNTARRDFGIVGRTFNGDWLRAVITYAVEASERGEPIVAAPKLNNTDWKEPQ